MNKAVDILIPSPIDYYGKNIHKRMILDIIRFTPGGASRADIARQLGLTRAAVSMIVSDILNEKLVRETESGPATGGRRPIMLEFNPQRGSVLGVDMGATHLGLVIADFSARVFFEEEIPFDVAIGPVEGLKMIDSEVRRVLAKAGISLSDILAVGMGAPGPVVAEQGLVSAPPIMPGWDNYPIRSHLERAWGCRVSLNNDAELGALGEWAYGAGRGEKHLAYIKVGSGVGGGLLLDGRIYRGATGCAGEIGHITINENGPVCLCGNRGCLEALSGGRAIARKAQEAVTAGRRTRLASIEPLESLSARDVAAAARMGDLAAQQIVAEAGNYLGIAAASLVNMFNPAVLIIGGGVSQMGDLLLDPIRKAIRERSLRSAAQSVRITSAVLGRRSSEVGAVVQALNTVLQQIT